MDYFGKICLFCLHRLLILLTQLNVALLILLTQLNVALLILLTQLNVGFETLEKNIFCIFSLFYFDECDRFVFNEFKKFKHFNGIATATFTTLVISSTGNVNFSIELDS